MDFGGFRFTIPYPSQTAEIIIKKSEEVLIEVNPQSKTLHDAIDGIPDHGFEKNPDQRRKALQNKVSALENMLDANNFKGAVKKLQKDIRPHLEDSLLEEYPVENPLQLTKNEVLELVDNIITRIQNLS